MDADVERALQTDTLVDITTTGRKSGRARRTEIWFHYIDGKVYITGSPGARGWYANVRANPNLTFHLKQSAQKDVPARVIPITDQAQKRRVFQRIQSVEDRLQNLNIEEWVSHSPLIEVQLAD